MNTKFYLYGSEVWLDPSIVSRIELIQTFFKEEVQINLSNDSAFELLIKEGFSAVQKQKMDIIKEHARQLNVAEEARQLRMAKDIKESEAYAIQNKK